MLRDGHCFDIKLHKSVQKCMLSLLIGRKSIHHHRGNPPFSFSESEASMVFALLSGPMVYTLFPCYPKDMVYTIALFCSVTSGSGDRPRKEMCHGGGVPSRPEL